MPTTTTTPNMTLVLPVPLQELGPTWAQDLVTALTRIDLHNHTPGLGVLVPTSGLNINADLPINGFNTTLHRTARFNSQSATLALGSDIGCIYNVLGDAYWNNATGTAIQLTKSGKVNATLVNYVTKTGVTGTYTILSSDAFQLYYVNVSAGAATINLPASAAVLAGFPYIFVDYTASASTHNITIVPAGTDQINGVNASYVIATSGATTYMFNDGAGHWTASSLTLPNNAFTAPIQGPRRTITTTFTIDSSGADYILMSNHGAAYNLTLPTPTNGRVIIVEDITGACETNPITLVRHGAENIDRVAASRILQTNLGRWTIESNGTDWFVKGCGRYTKQIFIASGTFNPPAGIMNVTVEGCGGGGGGGGGGSVTGTTMSGGGGGGGASFIRQNVVVVPGTPVTVTIGAAGAAGTASTGGAGGNGGNGGDTTFGALATFPGANGGQGGNIAAQIGVFAGGGMPVRTGYGAQSYNIVAASLNGTVATGGILVPGSGAPAAPSAGGGATGYAGPTGFAGGVGGTGGGGGGGGAYGVGGAGGASGATGVAGTAPAANTGAGGGGGGNATTGTNSSGAGAIGGTGQITVTWVD
jgi:hypothetical protein